MPSTGMLRTMLLQTLRRRGTVLIYLYGVLPTIFSQLLRWWSLILTYEPGEHGL